MTAFWTILPVLVAAGGAVLGHITGLLLGELLGAVIAVVVTCKLGFPLTMSHYFVVAVQLLLGMSVGSIITLELARSLTDVTVLCGLLICMTLQLVIGYSWLLRVEKWSSTESLLGAVPGALAAVMTLTGENSAASGRIVFTHMVRMIAILAMVSLIAGAPVSEPVSVWAPVSGYLWVVALALAALAVGWVLERFDMPAPYMLTGLIVTASANMRFPEAGINVPQPVVVLALLLLGGLIGIRLKDITSSDVLRYLRTGLIVTALTFSVTVYMAWLFSLIIGKPFLVLFMSWVPGGVEVMTATALLLGLEPAFVMLNHVVRMSIIHISPMFLRNSMFRDCNEK